MKIIFVVFILLINSSFSNMTNNLIDKNHNNEKYILIKYLKSNNLKSPYKNTIKKYYKYYKYNLFWIKDKKIKEISYELINAIKNDSVLKPIVNRYFDLDELNLLMNHNNKLSTEQIVKLDILLTKTYYRYMKYLSNGIINWKKFTNKLKQINKRKKIIANWRKYSIRKNNRRLLYKAIKQNNIYLAINKVNYTFPFVKQLENKLIELENINKSGGYIKVPKIKKALRLGHISQNILFLKKRLNQSNDYKIDKTCKNIDSFDDEAFLSKKECFMFDKDLFQAVLLFQKRNGLIQDGVVGLNTLNHINKSIEDEIKKIRINLERMRWLPRTLGKKFIVVNIPDFKLKLFKNNKVKLEMPVIVGRNKNPTPIFSNKLSEIVLNPYWRIPQGIVKKEIIPKLVKDANYLKEENIQVYENWDHESLQYDVSLVDWSMYLGNNLIGTPKEAPMRFIQLPGENNPLGKIKFLFPNPYSVYLHDTPLKQLFNHKTRTFSHGCIRVAKAKKLFETIISEDENIDYKTSDKIFTKKERLNINLNRTIPIHIVYLTSWIDRKGRLNLRDDVYNYDKIQSKILFSPSL